MRRSFWTWCLSNDCELLHNDRDFDSIASLYPLRLSGVLLCKPLLNLLVYTVKFSNAIYVQHAFQKKSKAGIKTPAEDLALIERRLKAAQAD